MIVQIFEPFEGGHHTSYVRTLLHTLSDLLEKKLIRKVVVTTSRAHRDSSAFADQLARYTSTIEFDTTLPPFGWGVNASPAMAKALLNSIARFRPNFLVTTSADNLSVALAGRSLIAPSLPKRLHSVGIFHMGYGEIAQRGIKGRMRTGSLRFGRRFSPWSELQIVNPLVYQKMKQRPSTRGRLRLLPHPVEQFARIDKTAARRALDIPVNGRYIGCIGASDHRKAIPELLQAFRAATSSQTDRLLLAGRLHEPYRALIEREFRDLVHQERVLLLDRYLTNEDMGLSLSAVDITAIAYYPREALSANLLNAAMAAQPVIADASGYAGMIVERFKLGWACDIRNHDALVTTIRKALAESLAYHPGKKLERLAAFHDPRNYADTVLSALYERIGLPAPELKTWEWATTASETGDPATHLRA